MIVVKGGVQGTPGMLMEGLLCIQAAGHAKQLQGEASFTLHQRCPC